MGKTLTAAVLVSSVSNTATNTTRGSLDCSAADGGMLRWAMTNGATAPSVQCVAKVLVACKQASMPSSAAENTGDNDWKIVYQQGAGTNANDKVRGSYRFGPEIAYIAIEFSGNNDQAVTVECTGDTYLY